MGIKHASFRFSGQVQGIGYRYFIITEAKDFKITGYVKNLTDGSVAGEAQGEEIALVNFFERIKKGHNRAVIKEAKIKYSDLLKEYESFKISPC